MTDKSLLHVTVERVPVVAARHDNTSLISAQLWMISHLLPVTVLDVYTQNVNIENNTILYSAVRVNGDTNSWFQVETGVRQGCILSPLLFAIAIDLSLIHI